MIHPVYRVHEFEIVDSYTLKVEFDDGTSQIIEFSPGPLWQVVRPPPRSFTL